jgi:hypothetical protein
MSHVKPWAKGALELLQHAEEHRLGARDFDRRVALIGFDNAIESSVITYLTLNPVQRGGRTFPKSNVEKWLTNFHSKVEFLEYFAGLQQQVMPVERAEIIYYHSLRNDLYHNGNGVIPAAEHIDGARRAALWTFSTLFDCDAQALLEKNESRDQQVLGGTPQLSASTAFLESFIHTKNEITELLAAMNKAVGGRIGLDRLLQILQEHSDVPASVVDATLEAEKTKELVIQGDEDRIDEAALRSLTSELDTVTEYLRQRLRSYQLEIVDTAISSTLTSAQRDGRAGIVSQVAGSGLSMTVLAYLVRCRETNELAGLPFIVLVDRADLKEGLVERMRALPAASKLTSVVTVNSGLEMERALEVPGPWTIVTTWQKLRSLSRGRKFTFSCLVVCFDSMQAGIPDFNLKSLFPRGNFILFAAGPVQRDDQRFELFGDLIRTYDFLTAVVDGYMLPVRIEHHSLAKNRSVLEIPCKDISKDTLELPLEAVRKIASAIVDDFQGKLKLGIRQAMLVTKSRTSMMVFARELAQLIEKRAQSRHFDDLAVVQLGSSTSVQHLYNDQESPIVWLSTAQLLAGVDLGPSVACYVVCKVSKNAQHRLISMVARPRGDAKEGFIVDYAGNHWETMFADKQ